MTRNSPKNKWKSKSFFLMEDLRKEFVQFSTNLPMLSFRKASREYVKLFFECANDELVRFNSYNQQPIIFGEHEEWFNQKLDDENYILLVFMNEYNERVAQV